MMINYVLEECVCNNIPVVKTIFKPSIMFWLVWQFFNVHFIHLNVPSFADIVQYTTTQNDPEI